jgi:hypothetical protein
MIVDAHVMAQLTNGVNLLNMRLDNLLIRYVVYIYQWYDVRLNDRT